MSFFGELEKQLQADLISYVEDREAKEKTGKKALLKARQARFEHGECG